MPRTEVTGAQIRDSSVSLTADITGVLPVANGGSGSATITLGHVVVGNGTGAVQTVAPGSSGNVLTSNGTSWVSQVPESVSNAVTSVAGRVGAVTLTVADVSGAQDVSQKGVASGYAALDSTGKVPLAQWADQVIDGGSASAVSTYTINGGSA